MELKGEDSWSYSHKIESVTLRKCPYDYYLTTHTHTRLTALFWDYPGGPVPERVNQSGFY